MKLTTTFWSPEARSFDELLFVNNNTMEVLFSGDLTNTTNTCMFFKSVAKFVGSRKFLESVRARWLGRSDDWWQFAVRVDGVVTPIVWFQLVVNEELIIAHDLAFSTTLIKRNSVVVPFGRFPMCYKTQVLPLYREFKLKARAYKFLANAIAR